MWLKQITLEDMIKEQIIEFASKYFRKIVVGLKGTAVMIHYETVVEIGWWVQVVELINGHFSLLLLLSALRVGRRGGHVQTGIAVAHIERFYVSTVGAVGVEARWGCGVEFVWNFNWRGWGSCPWAARACLHRSGCDNVNSWSHLEKKNSSNGAGHKSRHKYI